MTPFTQAMLDEGNAKHATEFANCTKDETLAIHKKGAAAAAAAVRGLSDAELDRSATVLSGMPAMTAQQIVEGILINHIDGSPRQHPQERRRLRPRRSQALGAVVPPRMAGPRRAAPASWVMREVDGGPLAGRAHVRSPVNSKAQRERQP